MRRFRSSLPMALTNVEAVSCTTASPVVSDFSFKSWRASVRANCGRLETTLSKSISYSTNLLRSARSMDFLPNQHSSPQLGHQKEWNCGSCPSSTTCYSAVDEPKPYHQMFRKYSGRQFCPAVDVRWLTSDFSIWDALIWCCRVRCSKRVHPYIWTAITYARSESLVPPRSCAAGASIVDLADSYNAHNWKPTVFALPQTLPIPRHCPAPLLCKRKNASAKS